MLRLKLKQGDKVINDITDPTDEDMKIAVKWCDKEPDRFLVINTPEGIQFVLSRLGGEVPPRKPFLSQFLETPLGEPYESLMVPREPTFTHQATVRWSEAHADPLADIRALRDSMWDRHPTQLYINPGVYMRVMQRLLSKRAYRRLRGRLKGLRRENDRKTR